MTQSDAVQHWQHGSQKALETARILLDGSQFESALFYCHLSVEKALKAAYIDAHDREPPKTHNLVFLATKLNHTWSDAELDDLQRLTEFVIDARYDEPGWSEHFATQAQVTSWYDIANVFISTLVS